MFFLRGFLGLAYLNNSLVLSFVLLGVTLIIKELIIPAAKPFTNVMEICYRNNFQQGKC